jgi:hypothetical protein
MRTISTLIALLFTINTFACSDDFAGKFIDENNAKNILEIKAKNCVPVFELTLAAESRKGHVLADNIDRVIWNQGGRKISQKASLSEDTLTVNIVDKQLLDAYYQTQTYKLTNIGIGYDVVKFNKKQTYNYKNHINYVRE